MLKLATLLDNPGEPQPESRYRDPKHLKALGYSGIVLYETTGLSGVDSPDVIGSGEIRRWVENQFEVISEKISRAREAGLEVYFVYDVLSLARAVVNREVGALVCKNRASTLCPASEAALELSGQSLVALLNRWTDVQGVVLRFGDNDAARLPYLVGNDIYTPHCARCSQLGRADRISLVLNHFYDIVVEQQQRRLIARAWNVKPNGMHDSAELSKRLKDRLPGDPKDDRFILSFKFTETDFWRWQRWNPASLQFGDRPIIYELQCQREFEGKGGIPDWQVPLWRDGYPETRGASTEGGAVSGLAQAAEKVNLAGLWAWVRGGGWGGPFIRNETWIDANVVAVPKLADNPMADPKQIAREWIHDRLGVKDGPVADAIQKVLEDSPRAVLQGFYIGPFARTKADPWHPNGDWIQDDLIDANAAWRMIQRLKEEDLDTVVQEKQDAVDTLAADRAALQHAMSERNRGIVEPLVNTLIYSESLFEALRDLLGGLIAYRRFVKSRSSATATQCKQRLLACQTHWNTHIQRAGALPGAATAFREAHLWDLTQRLIGEVTEAKV